MFFHLGLSSCSILVFCGSKENSRWYNGISECNSTSLLYVCLTLVIWTAGIESFVNYLSSKFYIYSFLVKLINLLLGVYLRMPIFQFNLGVQVSVRWLALLFVVCSFARTSLRDWRTLFGRMMCNSLGLFLMLYV